MKESTAVFISEFHIQEKTIWCGVREHQAEGFILTAQQYCLTQLTSDLAGPSIISK